MKHVLFILAIILIIPLVLSQDCNTVCLDSGYTSGICTDTCSDSLIEGGNDCTLAGQAVLIIGSEAVTTYKDTDPFIGEDEEDVEWEWIIKNIKTEAATNLLDTNDETSHTGPLLGIKNRFIATDIDAIGVKAKGTGGSFCFPDNIICIKFIELTVSDYGTYNIQKTTVDLSSFNSSWSNKDAILIHSVDDTTGLKLDTADYDVAAGSADGAETDNIWIIYNNTNSDAAIYYEGVSNVKTLAGYLAMDTANDDINIADIDYENTQGTDIQIDLRGDFGTANNLNLVLDILAFEGAAATEGADDITINLKHTADADITGFGASSGTAEDADLVWVSTNIGTKDEDHRSLYGIVIKDPKTNNAVDKVELEIPADQVKAKVDITKTASEVTKVQEAGTTVLGEQMPSPILSNEVKFKEDNSLIFVGGPCADPLVEEFNGFPTCSNWPLKPGEAMIKYAKNGRNTALLVAGTTAEDTKMATDFLKNFDQHSLEGTYIKIVNNEPEVLNSSSGGVDFSDYPSPFIKEGKFQNMLLIVGDEAKVKDTIGATDIASSLLQITRTSIEQSNVTEEITELDTTTTDEIPLGSNLADTDFFSAELSHSSIPTLIDHKVSFGGETYNYHEGLMLYATGPSIETSLSSSDDTYNSNVYMEATSGSLRYYYAFDSIINIDTTSVNSPLTINILDNELSLTSAETATEFKSQSANKFFMDTSDEITVDNIDIRLIDIDGAGSIKILLNSTSGIVNDTTEILKDGQTKFLAGLNVKNLESFDETGAYCCCTDLLEF
ncbi:MAG: hypothetical protein ABIB47_03255 [Candidatus Woesearchaeota archaeon]